ncbi:MAG: ABC transporter ATP-binding protein [Mesorhizobium sp.]|uniref:ABC transporter ATP-binding protein n=1 Tax=Mesorhizobium sp. TaxID=1871066 RepID=UPI0012057B23|nr:ABC transporter ATP-binding protein [Mesorhizobium sp.]TIU72057.1 MAG: ABC transporter ATP-binding protein [Mesorhizobium sp.]TIW10429.1 MAG: ABC transporter ATP-binding protein [Mesorhizobium sp.]TIX72758.1 MAG: ABC transporter ATP-binding protein [Mesorhizobium sp.]
MARTLRTEGIAVRFQGLKALDAVNLTLSKGQILGLLGPNGAGKTTLVNVLSGFQKPAAGRVMLDDEDMTGRAPEKFASRGIARTFQSVRLFKKLSVRENVEVAALAIHVSRRAAKAAVDEALDIAGLSECAHRQAGALPYALERLVGIARAMVLRPNFVLLDEPAAGMTDGESDQLVELIKRLPAQCDCGVLLIEHNMAVVMNACGQLHVLDGGRTLAQGEMAAVRDEPAVISAYLGSA